MSANPRQVGRLGRTVVAGLGLALLAALAASGCSTSGLLRVHASDSVERSLEVPAGTPVRVETFNGAIDVVTAAGPAVSARVDRTGEGSTRAEAEANRDRIEVTFRLVDGVAVLRAVYTPNPDSIPGGQSAEVTLRVPDNTDLQLVTSNGAVHARGTHGTAEVATSNGSVDLRDVGGALSVRTSNAPITVEAGPSTADLRTSNAALTFSGTLRPGSHRFETSNESVKLALPGDAAFVLDARTSNGRIDSEFAISGPATKVSVQGTAGPPSAAPATTIRAETSNAPISIVKR